MSLLPDFEYFYFIRHGRTDANDQSLMAGGTNDIHINETGQKQALSAAQILKKQCQDIQSICASTMTRAQQTASIIQKELTREIQTCQDLMEWRFGDWEGRHWNDVAPLFLDETCHPENGECRVTFKNRVLSGLNFALSQKHPVLIVAHGGVWYMVQKIFNLPLMKTDNCQIFKIFKENGKYNYYEITL